MVSAVDTWHADQVPAETAALAELQRLLNQWDPIGVYDPLTNFPEDEYDCLYHPPWGSVRSVDVNRKGS